MFKVLLPGTQILRLLTVLEYIQNDGLCSHLSTTNSYNSILRSYMFLSYQKRLLQKSSIWCAVILQSSGIKAPAIPEDIFPANCCFSCNIMRNDRRLPSFNTNEQSFLQLSLLRESKGSYSLNTMKTIWLPTRTWLSGKYGGQRTRKHGNQCFQAWGRNHNKRRPCSQRKMRFAWSRTYLILQSSNTSNSHKWTSQLIHHRGKTYKTQNI